MVSVMSSAPAIKIGTAPDGVATWTGPVVAATANDANWDNTVHRSVGNVGLGDGSSQQVTYSAFQKQIQAALNNGSANVLLKCP